MERDEWARRVVARWRDSGLTTAEFASEVGINPRTLKPHGDTIVKPVMRRMTLPKRLARELLATLAHEEVTGATVFPGYAGAVLRMREDIIASQRLSHFGR